MVTSNAAFVGSQVRILADERYLQSRVHFPADELNISTWGLDILRLFPYPQLSGSINKGTVYMLMMNMIWVVNNLNFKFLLHTHLQHFGILMHVGSCATKTSECSKSKTEPVYIPVDIPLLMRLNQIPLILTYYVTVEASSPSLTNFAKSAPSSLAMLKIALTSIGGSTNLLKLLAHFVLASSVTKNSSSLLPDIIFSWRLSWTLFYGAATPGRYCQRTATGLMCVSISGVEPCQALNRVI